MRSTYLTAGLGQRAEPGKRIQDSGPGLAANGVADTNHHLVFFTRRFGFPIPLECALNLWVN